MPFRIAIVNALGMAREALRRVVAAIPDTAVGWPAADGAEARDKARTDRPDLVLMDLIMPVMDGVECTRNIMREAPCPIVVFTATVEGNASRVYDAIGAGALDAHLQHVALVEVGEQASQVGGFLDGGPTGAADVGIHASGDE